MVINKTIFTLLTIYLCALFASNTLGMKTMPFLFDTHLSVAIFFFPIVFLMTDIVGEVFGKPVSKMFFRMGLLATILQLSFTLVSNLVPASEHFTYLASYNDVFSLSFRFAIASVIAFLIGEFQDVISFMYLKAKLAGRFFILRSFLSNLWGQLLDTAIWMTIAFAGVYSPSVILKMAIPWFGFKVLMGLAYSPIALVCVKFLKNSSAKDEEVPQA
jgi:queuosine precursor transporter